jgi:hypothetical protein
MNSQSRKYHIRKSRKFPIIFTCTYTMLDDECGAVERKQNSGREYA